MIPLAILTRLGGWLKAVPLWAFIMVGLALFGGVQSARLNHAKAQVAEARADSLAATRAAEGLNERIIAQNLGIAADKAAGEARERALVAKLAQAKPVAARHQAKADALAVYTPAGDDTLAQLVDLDAEISR